MKFWFVVTGGKVFIRPAILDRQTHVGNGKWKAEKRLRDRGRRFDGLTDRGKDGDGPHKCGLWIAELGNGDGSPGGSPHRVWVFER